MGSILLTERVWMAVEHCMLPTNPTTECCFSTMLPQSLPCLTPPMWYWVNPHLVVRVKQTPPSATTLSYPQGVAVVGSSLWVADTGNNR